MIEIKTYSAERISQDNELISLTTPYNLTFRCQLPDSMQSDMIIKLALELIQNGIPVVPRDEGTSLIGPIFSPLDYERLIGVLNRHSLSAIFGYHPENNKFPICFNKEGSLISLGSPAIVSTYRVRVNDFNDWLKYAFMLDENGNYEGCKGSKLSLVPLEKVLSTLPSDDAVNGLNIMEKNPDFYQAVLANWQIDRTTDLYCLYIKVDVNGSSSFFNDPKAIFDMNNYFNKLSQFAAEYKILTGENTGESIILYPQEIKQVGAIRDLVLYSKNPFTTKMVVLGPRMERRLHITTTGFCPIATTRVEAYKVGATEQIAKENGLVFYHNMRDKTLHLSI